MKTNRLLTDAINQCIYNTAIVQDDDSIAIETQLASLEEALSLKIEEHDKISSMWSKIETLREEIAYEADKCSFEEAGSKLHEAVLLSKEFLSFEEVNDAVRLGYVEKIDITKRTMIKTYSGESMNFLDSVVAAGKRIIEKIVEFIMAIYRAIKNFIKRILGRVGLKATATKKNKGQNSVQIGAGKSSEILNDGYDEVNGHRTNKGIERDDQVDIDSRKTYNSALDKELADHYSALSYIKIPMYCGESLWNYERGDVYTSLDELYSGMIKAKPIAIDYIRDVFMALSRNATDEYYGIMSYAFMGTGSSSSGKYEAAIARATNDTRIKALEEAINDSFYDKINIPHGAENKVFYPGIGVRMPDKRKQIDIKNLVILGKPKSALVADRISKATFKVPHPMTYVNWVNDINAYIVQLNKASDDCEGMISKVENKLKDLITMSALPASKERFKRIATAPRNWNTGAIVMSYNKTILDILMTIAKSQMKAVSTINSLTSGAKDKSSSPGILKLLADEINKGDWEITFTS